MSEFKLAAHSALAPWDAPARLGRPGEIGVLLAHRSEYALASVIARNARQSALAARIAEAFECQLPFQPKRAQAGAVSFAWAGPGRWLAAEEPAQAPTLATRLRQRLADLAVITDQSDGLVVLGVAGPKARETLAKGLPIDLDARQFTAHSVAITVAAHMRVTLWQIDLAPSYELAVLRSYAASFWHWLVDAAAEFGVRIVSDADFRGRGATAADVQA